MTKSILDDVLLLRNQPIEKIQDYFKSIGCTIFDTILSRQAVPGKDTILEFEPKNTVLFILAAYSEDSPLVILRQDAKEEKQAICEYLGIPEFMQDRLMNLTEPEIRKSATQYLEQFAGPEYKALMFMRIQYNDFERDVTNREFTTKKTQKDGEGEAKEIPYYDIKEHGKAIAEMLRLAKSISNLEKEFKSKGTYRALEEMKSWKIKKNKGDGGRSGNVEKFI